ncbi:hypothetical protein TcG_09620, partial [Trypanosoma cruzi]
PHGTPIESKFSSVFPGRQRGPLQTCPAVRPIQAKQTRVRNDGVAPPYHLHFLHPHLPSPWGHVVSGNEQHGAVHPERRAHTILARRTRVCVEHSGASNVHPTHCETATLAPALPLLQT